MLKHIEKFIKGSIVILIVFAFIFYLYSRTYAVGVNKCINSNIKLDTNKQLRRFEKSFMAA